MAETKPISAVDYCITSLKDVMRLRLRYSGSRIRMRHSRSSMDELGDLQSNDGTA
jgi:hypothetical protein